VPLAPALNGSRVTPQIFSFNSSLQPVALAANSRREDLRIVECRNLRQDVELVACGPSVKCALGIEGQDVAIQIHIFLTKHQILREHPHRLHPVADIRAWWPLVPFVRKVSPGEFLPGPISFNRPGKDECLSTFHAREEPAAPAPRAIYLWGIGDQGG